MSVLSRRETDEIREELGSLPFGGERLFSYLFAPVDASRPWSLVVCPSFFELKTLQPVELSFARAAAGLGFHVVYVQPPGTGESAGANEDCLFDVRVRTAEVAARFLSERFETAHVGFAGARLGGAVAIRAAERWSDLTAAIVWDPVIVGAHYWRQAKRLERISSLAGRRSGSGSPEAQLDRRGWATMLGNVVTVRLYEEILGLRIDSGARVPGSAFAVTLDEGGLESVRRSLDAMFDEVEGLSLGKRDLGHLGMGPDDLVAAMVPTLEWLQHRLD